MSCTQRVAPTALLLAVFGRETATFAHRELAPGSGEAAEPRNVDTPAWRHRTDAIPA
jgi:hypothetical protein